MTIADEEKEVQEKNCSALTARIIFPLTYSSLSGKIFALTTPHELTNFHILKLNVKQFEALGNKHL